MNRIGHVVTLAAYALLCTATAYAQQRYDPAIPRGLPSMQVEPLGEVSQPAAAPLPPRLIQNRKRHQRDADARQCLERPTNKAVHRCSLPYRSHASKRAATVKTKAKAPASTPLQTEAPRTPDVFKPGAPRPGDAAKAEDIVKPMDVSKARAPASPAAAAAAAASKGPVIGKPPTGVPTPVTTPGAPAKSAK